MLCLANNQQKRRRSRRWSLTWTPGQTVPAASVGLLRWEAMTGRNAVERRTSADRTKPTVANAKRRMKPLVREMLSNWMNK